MRTCFLFILSLFVSVSAFAEDARWLRYPSISPDGQTVAFSYKGDIYLVGTQGGEAKQLTSNTAYDYAPVWSPDGKTVAFASDRYGNFDIFTVSVEGATDAVSTNYNVWIYEPASIDATETYKITLG